MSRREAKDDVKYMLIFYGIVIATIIGYQSLLYLFSDY